MLSNALQDETVPDADGKDSTRTVLKLHPAIAPIKCAVLPLLKNKPELTDKARAIFDDLKSAFQCQYDEKDAIGRRYRRQDAIGTPFCVTIDFETLEDNCVTLRDRDTLVQVRLPITEVEAYVAKRVDMRVLLGSTNKKSATKIVGKKYSEEFKLKVVKENKEGASKNGLSRKYSIDIKTIQNWVKKYGHKNTNG
jgi:hypothetical protein